MGRKNNDVSSRECSFRQGNPQVIAFWDDPEQDYDHGRQGRCYDSHKRPRWVSPDFGHSKSCKIQMFSPTSMLDVHRVDMLSLLTLFSMLRGILLLYPKILPCNGGERGDGSRVPHSVKTHRQNTGKQTPITLLQQTVYILLTQGAGSPRMALVQFYLVLGILFLKGG